MTPFILDKITVAERNYGCNCYFIGSEESGEIFIVDPGAEPERIIKKVRELEAIPIAAILTHGHPDHYRAYEKIKTEFQIPLWYHEKDYKYPARRDIGKADRWIKEGDVLSVGELNLYVIETPGHTPGSVSFYTHNIKEFRDIKCKGVIFTGDLLFRREKGLTTTKKREKQLDYNIKHKIMYNSALSDDFLILAAHKGLTTIGEEKEFNLDGKDFLTDEDWQKNRNYSE